MTDISLHHLVRTFLDVLRSERRASPYTVRNYEHALGAFARFLQGHLGEEPTAKTLRALKTRDYRAFLASRHGEGLDPATVRLDLSALRSFYRYWDRRGVLPSAALSALKSPKKRQILPRPVDAGAAADLIGSAHSIGAGPDWARARDAALFTLLFGAGLRISEALQLDWHDVQDPLRIRGKGSKTRDVPLLPRVKTALCHYREAVASQAPHLLLTAERPLFLGVRGGRLSASVAQARMRAIRRALGLPDSATPHALRHGFATELLAGGADLRVIQELLGHASLASTQRYTAIDPDRLAREHHRCHPRSQRRPALPSAARPR